MNKYKNLVNNTLIFALGTFGSKVLVFLLMPLYTRLLTTAEYGQAGILVDTCNLILPVMYLSVTESIIRFGMDRSAKRSDIFSIGIYVVLAGYLALLVCRPLLDRALTAYAEAAKVTFTTPHYLLLIYLYVLTSALHSVISQFVRAGGLVKIFAMDGIITTLSTLVLNIIFLAVFKMGVAGYLLATITADGLSALGLFFLLRLYKFLKIKGVTKGTVKTMLAFSIPLIPTSVFWWITNLSDRYLVAYFHGWDITGLYEASYKLPTIITLVSTIFIRAWELSAFTEYDQKEAESFYSTVFKSYYTFIFIAASAIILLVKPITIIMVAPSYYASWRYVPFLILGTSFSCLVTFMGSIYMAAKKTAMSLFTTFLGAAANIILNLLLIPKHGGVGAAFATFISYLLVYTVRAVNTRRFLKLRVNPFAMLMNLCLLLTQSWMALSEAPWWPFWEILIFLSIILLNINQVLLALDQLYRIFIKRGRNPA